MNIVGMVVAACRTLCEQWADPPPATGKPIMHEHPPGCMHACHMMHECCSTPNLSCDVAILSQAADPQHLLLAAVPFSERAGMRVLLVYDASGTGEVSKQGSCARGVAGHAWLGGLRGLILLYKPRQPWAIGSTSQGWTPGRCKSAPHSPVPPLPAALLV